MNQLKKIDYLRETLKGLRPFTDGEHVRLSEEFMVERASRQININQKRFTLPFWLNPRAKNRRFSCENGDFYVIGRNRRVIPFRRQFEAKGFNRGFSVLSGVTSGLRIKSG